MGGWGGRERLGDGGEGRGVAGGVLAGREEGVRGRQRGGVRGEQTRGADVRARGGRQAVGCEARGRPRETGGPPRAGARTGGGWGCWPVGMLARCGGAARLALAASLPPPLRAARRSQHEARRAAARGAAQAAPDAETLAAPAAIVNEVKKSKFVATAAPVASVDEARELIAMVSEPDASHNCWAYRLERGAVAKASDDGEPGGTAGRPILAAIEASGLDAVCVVVTRFYGGVKLGAGGLARAYGGAASDALKAGERLAVPTMQAGALRGFEARDLGAVYSALAQCEGARKLADEDYAADGTVSLAVEVHASRFDELADALRSATNGRLELEALEDGAGL